MPKLSEKAVERKKGQIEDAAKQLFIRQGFHATSMRNISARAGTSLGNLITTIRLKRRFSVR